MNWEAVGAVAELLGAAGVIVSLAYLALQVRQNTRQMSLNAESLSMTHEMGGAQLSNQIGMHVLTDPSLAELVRKARDVEAELSAHDRMRWGTYLFSSLLVFQAGYHNYQKGLADEDAWQAHARNMVLLMDCSGARSWWVSQRHRYSDSFAQYLDRELDEPSGTRNGPPG